MNFTRYRVFLHATTRNGVVCAIRSSRNVNPLYRCGHSSADVLLSRQKSKWYYAPEDVDAMSRRELQQWCKKLRIRANSKTIQLRSDLLDYHRDILSKSPILNYPFVPSLHSKSHSLQIQFTPETMQHEKRLFGTLGAYSNWVDINGTGLSTLRRYRSLSCDMIETDEGVVDVAATIGFQDRLPSVSGILRATAPKGKLFAILHWAKKQKALLGEEGFREKMNKIKRNGIDFHRFIHQCLENRSLNTKGPESLQGYIESTKNVFDKLGDAVDSERSVSHSDLGYKGRLDTLASYEGNPCVIEWKTSQKRKPSLGDCGDYPMQVVAYAGAINRDSSFGFKVKHGLIVIAYEDGTPADVHCLDLNLSRNIWEDWLLRIHQFYQLNVKEN